MTRMNKTKSITGRPQAPRPDTHSQAVRAAHKAGLSGPLHSSAQRRAAQRRADADISALASAEPDIIYEQLSRRDRTLCMVRPVQFVRGSIDCAGTSFHDVNEAAGFHGLSGEDLEAYQAGWAHRALRRPLRLRLRA